MIKMYERIRKYRTHVQEKHNPQTKLNSIHHKRVINTGKGEGMNSASYNSDCNGKMIWDEDGDGAGDEDDGDDDLDDARDDGDDDGDDLHLREEFSPAELA